MVDKPRKPTGRRVKFGDVVRLVTDRCDPAAEGVERYVGLEHIEPNDFRIRKWGMVADGTTFTNRFRSGQVLFGKRRAYQRKVAVADFDGVCSGDIYVFESADPRALLPELLPFLCQTETFFKHAVGTSAGSLSPRTNWTSLADYEFALPPPEDQHRIATCLIALQNTAESLDELTQTSRTTQASLARELFHSRLHSRALHTVITSSAYGPRFPSTLYADSDVATAWTIRTTDFGPNGTIKLDDVPGARLDSAMAQQHAIEDGDFLLSRSGEYAGMVRVFRHGARRDRLFIPAAFIIRFRLNATLMRPDFLFEYCESPQGRARVRSLARGSAQPNISGSSFLELDVPCPSTAEQDRVCAVLQSARDQVIAVEKRLADAGAMLGHYRDHLLMAHSVE